MNFLYVEMFVWFKWRAKLTNFLNTFWNFNPIGFRILMLGYVFGVGFDLLKGILERGCSCTFIRELTCISYERVLLKMMISWKVFGYALISQCMLDFMNTWFDDGFHGKQFLLACIGGKGSSGLGLRPLWSWSRTVAESVPLGESGIGEFVELSVPSEELVV